MSNNSGGRPRGSKNQLGHSAGGTRAGAGRKATDSVPMIGTPAALSMRTSRSTGTAPQLTSRGTSLCRLR